jgi:hypothetical protein
MKCAKPTCNHSIGLVSHRRGFFGKRHYCSKECRDHVAVESLPKSERATTYFEWLFMQPVNLQPRMAVATVRVRTRRAGSIFASSIALNNYEIVP